jgi:imidazolonepropionase-like amidohydrolase
MTLEADDAAGVLGCVERLLEARVDLITIKVHRQDFKLDRKRWFTVDEMRPGVERAHAAGLRVGAIAQEPLAYRRAVEAGVDVVSSGRFIYQDPELPRFLAEHQVTLTPSVAGWARAHEFMNDEWREGHRTGVRRCIEAGVPIAAGTTFYGEDLVDEIRVLRELGLDALGSLLAATRNGARALGQEREVGTIEVGKRADLLLVRGDPLADPEVLRDPALVVRAGVEHDPAALRQAVGAMTEIG